MAKLTKFGKPAAPILSIKRSFFDDNDALLASQVEMAAFYVTQPRRVACMTCAAPLGEASFHKMGVPYVICRACGHLNGAHQDTDAFVERIYTAAEGGYYASAYASADEQAFNQRVASIYDPKAAFLFDGLRADGADPSSLTYCDIGSGSGYFLKALLNRGVQQPTGYEVSPVQAAYSNRMVPDATCSELPIGDLANVVGTLRSDVVCMIGVLEHLQRPRELIAALKGNPAVRYLFLAVPMHSPTTFIEMAFPHVMQRQLSGDHTHLYAESSIDHLCEEFGMSRIAEWWFGSDMMDLYRALSVSLKSEAVDAMLLPLVDPMQEAIDRRKASSEVHMLLAFERPREGSVK